MKTDAHALLRSLTNGFGGQDGHHSAARDRQDCLPHPLGRGNGAAVNMGSRLTTARGRAPLRVAAKRVWMASRRIGLSLDAFATSWRRRFEHGVGDALGVVGRLVCGPMVNVQIE